MTFINLPSVLTITNFSSISYLIFLAAIIVLYYATRKSFITLLIASVFFYASFSWRYCLLAILLFSVIFLVGHLLARYRNKWILTIGIIICLSVLGYFRYTGFLFDNLLSLTGKQSHVLLHIIAPLGISFFVFELIHYLVDIYRGQRLIKSYTKFLLFPLFFPSQIAGPIKRYEDFIPQLDNKKINWPLMTDGLLLVIKGLFKKVVIADTFARYVAAGFDTSATPEITIIAVYAFAIQIYFDFSGYTDIGRGSAALLGINIPVNFLQPYLSHSIPEFWRRWHVTLMAWFRDYLYIPLGGNRVNKVRSLTNIGIVFFVSGLWHGAAWHFIIWGLYHGLLVIITPGIVLIGHNISTNVSNSLLVQKNRLLRQLINSPQSRSITQKSWSIISVIITFHLVCLGWILFRARDTATALIMLKKMTKLSNHITALDSTLVFMLLLLIIYSQFYRINKLPIAENLRVNLRLAAFGLAIVIILLHSQISTTQFIYFQF